MMTGIFRDTYLWNDLVHGSRDFGAWFHAPPKQSMPNHSDLCRVGSVATVVWWRPVREVDPLDQLIHAHDYPRTRIAVWPMGCEKEAGHLQLQTEWLGEGQSKQRLLDLF